VVLCVDTVPVLSCGVVD